MKFTTGERSRDDPPVSISVGQNICTRQIRTTKEGLKGKVLVWKSS